MIPDFSKLVPNDEPIKYLAIDLKDGQEIRWNDYSVPEMKEFIHEGTTYLVVYNENEEQGIYRKVVGKNVWEELKR